MNTVEEQAPAKHKSNLVVGARRGIAVVFIFELIKITAVTLTKYFSGASVLRHDVNHVGRLHNLKQC